MSPNRQLHHIIPAHVKKTIVTVQVVTTVMVIYLSKCMNNNLGFCFVAETVHVVL